MGDLLKLCIAYSFHSRHFYKMCMKYLENNFACQNTLSWLNALY